MKRNSKNLYWWFCCMGVAVLSLLSFTPLVIPAGVDEPTIGGIPRTLWSGVLIGFAIVLLTFVGALVHPEGAPGPADEK